MNAIDQQLARTLASEAARSTRVEVYADWLAHDCDGLAAALTMPTVFPGSTAILAEAHALVALALSRLDVAIERDKAAHQEQA